MGNICPDFICLIHVKDVFVVLYMYICEMNILKIKRSPMKEGLQYTGGYFSGTFLCYIGAYGMYVDIRGL